MFASAAILADGSSTVFPITQEAAKRSKLAVDNRFSGTTAGFRRFCAGETDISNASRPINREEMASCEAAGVRYVELPIAFDAIAIVVNGSNDWVRDITTDELKTLWQPQAEGQKITWQDLRAEWPDRPVSLFGRGSNSGTYDYFTTVINGETRASRSDYLASENEESRSRPCWLSLMHWASLVSVPTSAIGRSCMTWQWTAVKDRSIPR
ncbi:substrate-binding domain-containing protein [Halopseudomonas pachastrellae]|nr:substrate-binding domain-containing protein [Halopseudomonas pachastrellae]